MGAGGDRWRLRLRCGRLRWNQWSELCCACGLCTLYACPEDLYPKEACDDGKKDRRAAGLKFVQQKPVEVHPMKEYRRVPLSQLRKRLQVEEYERETPFQNVELPSVVGPDQTPATCGTDGDGGGAGRQTVKKGQVIGRVEDSKLGANIHASIDGKVRLLTPDFVEITA